LRIKKLGEGEGEKLRVYTRKKGCGKRGEASTQVQTEGDRERLWGGEKAGSSGGAPQVRTLEN